MTKQQIVVQLAATKFGYNGVLPNEESLKNYGELADKIIEMFPEPSVNVNVTPVTVLGWDKEKKEIIYA